jgi:hypothetical protein
MQKYILSLIILLSSFQLSGQGISFSVVLDPQINWMHSDSKRIDREGTKFGFGGGLVIDNYFKENYAFSTGLFLQGMGGSLRFTDSLDFTAGGVRDTLPAGSTVKYNLQYVTIPVSLKLKSNEIGYFKFFAHLGVNAHLNVKATGDVEMAGIQGEDIRDEIRFFLMSYFIGSGLEYSLGGNTALIGGIYWTSGILDVSTNESYRAGLNGITLRIGVQF